MFTVRIWPTRTDRPVATIVTNLCFHRFSFVPALPAELLGWDTDIYPTRIPFLYIHTAQSGLRILDGCTNTHSNPAFETNVFLTLIRGFGANEATNGRKQKWSKLSSASKAEGIFRITHPKHGYDPTTDFFFSLYFFCVHIRRTDQRSELVHG